MKSFETSFLGCYLSRGGCRSVKCNIDGPSCLKDTSVKSYFQESNHILYLILTLLKYCVGLKYNIFMDILREMILHTIAYKVME